MQADEDLLSRLEYEGNTITVKDAVVKALTILGGSAKYEDIYKCAGKIRYNNENPTDVQRSAIRAEIENKSSDSKNFKGKNNLFYNAGRGVWGLRKAVSVPESESLSGAAADSGEKTEIPVFTPEQIIFYGVPGSGKSYKIDNEKTKGAKEYQKQKVVFHPDYTNADFVGQIIPRMHNSTIEYSFKPGPFTTILRRALRDPMHRYFLLIEEINRGNAAAIFGDLFQLLDRTEDGWSCSPVSNDDINSYIASPCEFWDDSYEDNHEYDGAGVAHPDSIDDFNRNTSIRLPPNLSIYATMNTNDQNVFTLDNAFQRRFNQEYISNKADKTIPSHVKQYNTAIGSTGIRWGAFRDVINKVIIENGFANAEDKQLGLFFIKPEKDSDVITEKDFSQKVLKYLWTDVFKRNKDIFNPENIRQFEDLVDNFEGKNAFANCFSQETIDMISEKNIEFA